RNQAMRQDRSFSHLFLFVALIALMSFPLRTATVQQNNAEAYNQQGLALMAAEKFQDALGAFQQAIKLKPDYAAAYCHLGDAHWELDDVKKAIDAYKQAIRYQPDFAAAYNGLGTAYRERDYKKSIEAYNESIRLDPKIPLTHCNMGSLYAQREKRKEAITEYKILQTLDAVLAQDLYNLIYKPTVSIVTDGAVRLNAIPIDSRGALIAGLTSDDFQVLDQGA